MNTECQELKNIQYKTMLLSGNKKGIEYKTASDISNLELFLNKESELTQNEPWSKLDKTIKLQKLNDYVDIIAKGHSLSALEIKQLKRYLSNSLDKKKLQRVKDVCYDKQTGIIKNIPCLHFNTTSRKFTLKRSDKHVSTLKCLAPKKRKSSKTLKNSDKIDTDIKD